MQSTSVVVVCELDAAGDEFPGEAIVIVDELSTPDMGYVMFHAPSDAPKNVILSPETKLWFMLVVTLQVFTIVVTAHVQPVPTPVVAD